VRPCREARDAVAAGLWRFDASDLMPPVVGAITESSTPGAFLQGMIGRLPVRRIGASFKPRTWGRSAWSTSTLCGWTRGWPRCASVAWALAPSGVACRR
jgi:hypothetical protein